MAFDGIVIAGLVHELNQTILNTKISKIAQPENDELLLTCKGSSGQFRVSISANASLPFLYLTDTNKTSPLQAPTFCMVLRKHIANGRIISITQPHMERIIHLTDTADELTVTTDCIVVMVAVDADGKSQPVTPYLPADDEAKALADSVRAQLAHRR